jgi:hypothetical protein
MTDNSHLKDRSAAGKRGLALLAALLRCRRCGCKLMVCYTGNGPFVLRYACHRSYLDNGEQPCISLSGLSLDEAISQDILHVVQPAAVDAAVLVSEQEALQKNEILEALQSDPEAARYARAPGSEAVRYHRSGESACRV